MSDIPRALDLSVVLVVGVRLGCLNHARLTAEAIVADGLGLAGWVANIPSPDAPVIAGQLDTLKSRLSAPLLGVVPYLDDPRSKNVAPHLEIFRLGGDDF